MVWKEGGFWSHSRYLLRRRRGSADTAEGGQAASGKAVFLESIFMGEGNELQDRPGIAFMLASGRGVGKAGNAVSSSQIEDIGFQCLVQAAPANTPGKGAGSPQPWGSQWLGKLPQRLAAPLSRGPSEVPRAQAVSCDWFMSTSQRWLVCSESGRLRVSSQASSHCGFCTWPWGSGGPRHFFWLGEGKKKKKKLILWARKMLRCLSLGWHLVAGFEIGASGRNFRRGGAGGVVVGGWCWNVWEERGPENSK